MIKNNSYPLQPVKAFRAGEISRTQFINQFSAWQKSCGMNFDCKGSADKNNTYITYRGVTAKIINGVLCRKRATAANIYNFQRQIDCAINKDNKDRHMELKDIPESEVIQQVKQVIKTTGLKLQRINAGCFTVGEGRNRRYIKTVAAGTCDFEGYDNHGRFLAIECKRPVGGNLSPAQKARIEDINAKGGVAFVAHSSIEALELLHENKCI